MLGWAIYSETLSTRWWLGLMCLTIGTALVQPRSDAKITEQKNEKEYRRGRHQHRKTRQR